MYLQNNFASGLPPVKEYNEHDFGNHKRLKIQRKIIRFNLLQSL